MWLIVESYVKDILKQVLKSLLFASDWYLFYTHI